jgi:hypothetical protein
VERFYFFINGFRQSGTKIAIRLDNNGPVGLCPLLFARNKDWQKGKGKEDDSLQRFHLPKIMDLK